MILSNEMQTVPTQRRPLLDLHGAPVLILGVTGHRDLKKETVAQLEKCVGEKLAALKKEFVEARIVVMSALAEGADQLVAKVAVDELGLELVVPLPFPAETCGERFENNADREEFDRLLNKAARHVSGGMKVV